MTVKKKNLAPLYVEEEDYAWSLNERSYDNRSTDNRTVFNLFAMVVKCFFPEKYFQRRKKTGEKPIEKQFVRFFSVDGQHSGGKIGNN